MTLSLERGIPNPCRATSRRTGGPHASGAFLLGRSFVRSGQRPASCGLVPGAPLFAFALSCGPP
ncbi:UNVERIFIED_ORG: hypothetical protein GGE63_004055 [Rhizobium esperanzae]